MSWKFWLGCGLLLLLSGCGGNTKPPVVENPYEQQMQELTSNGVLAMRRESWVAAEHSFTRALQAAQLTADPVLIAHAWYNLGMAYVAEGRLREGDEALLHAEGLASRHHLSDEYERARLNRALLAVKQGHKAWQPPPLPRQMPVDVHLAAARLAGLQGRMDTASEEYQLVLRSADKHSAAGLRYRAEAHLGLARLALKQHQPLEAMKRSEQALEVCRQVGVPRLTAQALMLKAGLTNDPTVRLDSLERVRGIYHALRDVAGERKALLALLDIAVENGNEAAEKKLRDALTVLGEKENP